jgi:hypothetical protein
VAVPRVSTCAREPAILPKSRLQFAVLGVNWRLDALGELSLEIQQAGIPALREKFLHRISRKVGCAIRGLNTLGLTTTTDLLRVVELYNGNYHTTS